MCDRPPREKAVDEVDDRGVQGAQVVDLPAFHPREPKGLRKHRGAAERVRAPARRPYRL